MAYNLNFAYNSSTNSYKVTGATGTGTSIVIPSTYNGPQGILDVTIIDSNAFVYFFSLSSVTIPDTIIEIRQNAFFQTSISTIYIPKNVSLIEQNVFANCNFLTSITVDIDNETYYSDSGILYNKEQTTLLFYPPGKNDNSFTIPNQVETLGPQAMRYAIYLTTINIPQNVISADVAALPYAALQTINVDSQNPNYSSEFGVFYNKNKTSLLKYPPGKQDISFNVPNTVTSINNFGFQNVSILQNIIFSNNLTSIGVLFCEFATSLQKIFFLGNAPSLGVVPFNNTNINLKVYRYSTKSGWSSTFGGKAVLLIDSPIHQGLQTFGFGTNSLGQASVEKTNVGSGRLTLSKFDPRNISDIALWTKQGSLNSVDNKSVVYLKLIPYYSGGDIDTDYYPDDNLFTSYTGVDFGFKIIYDEGVGLWYLYDLTENDIGFTENLLSPLWYTYGDLSDLEYDTHEVEAFTSTGDTIKLTWPDVSGKNNHLTSRPFPRNFGINSTIIGNYFNPFNGPSDLQTKGLNTPLKTTNAIDLLKPFTIYMVLFDGYTGTNTRRILGISGRAVGINYSNLYLESTASGGNNHTFSLKYYDSLTGSTQTAFSVNLNKSVFANSTYQHGSSILKLSSNYTTTSASLSRTMTLTYYNLLKNTTLTTTPNIGSAYRTGNILLFGSSYMLSSAPRLYISSDSYGRTLLSTFLVSEVLIYNKYLNNQEDGSIIRYLERKYYGKLLP